MNRDIETVERMILNCAGGDRSAFFALYDMTSPKLFGICLRVLNDRAEAEDALQDVFLKVWRNADRYAPNGLSPMTWLITIARNTAIDRLRRRRARAPDGDQSAFERLEDQAPGPEATAIAASEARRVVDCLDELEPGRADAVRGVYLDGVTYQVMAERHGVPLNTMRTWLRRSLGKLKECLSR